MPEIERIKGAPLPGPVSVETRARLLEAAMRETASKDANDWPHVDDFARRHGCTFAHARQALWDAITTQGEATP